MNSGICFRRTFCSCRIRDGFLRAQAIGRGGHEEKIALVERRHEFAAQVQNRE